MQNSKYEKTPIKTTIIDRYIFKIVIEKNALQYEYFPPCVLKEDQEVYKIPWDAGVKWEE